MAPEKLLATSMFVCTVGEVTKSEFNMTVEHLTSFETLTEGLLVAELVPVDRYTTWMIFARGCIATLIKEQCNAATLEHVRRAITEFFDMYADTYQADVDTCCGKCVCGMEEPTNEEKASDDEDEEADDKVSKLFFSIDENGDITFDAHAAVGTKGEKLFNTVATSVRNTLLDAAMQEAKAKVAEEASKKSSKAKTKNK